MWDAPRSRWAREGRGPHAWHERGEMGMPFTI